MAAKNISEYFNLHVPSFGGRLENAVHLPSDFTVVAANDIDVTADDVFQKTLTANWSPNVTGLVAGKETGFMLELINAGLWASTWTPLVNWIAPDGSTNTDLSATGVVLNTDGTSDWFLVWTTDGVTLNGKVLR